MSLCRTSAVALAIGWSVVAQSPLNVVAVDRLCTLSTTNSVLNFLVSFNDPATGVDPTDFAPISGSPSATVSGFGNEALDMRFGGGRPTRAFAESFNGLLSNNVTIEFWMATDDTGGTMFDYAVAGDLDQLRVSHNGPAGTVEFMVHGAVLCSTAAVVNDQSWHHVAATWTSSTGDAKLYVDGALADSGNGSAGVPLSTGGVATLGSNATAATSPPTFGGNLYGRYDDLRIWGVVRSGANIAGSMNRAQRPTATNLLLNWQCDLAEDLGVGASGANDLRDISGGQNHGECGAATTPQFVVGPVMDGLRHRVTVTLTGVAAQQTGYIGLAVLNDGSITRISNGASLAAGFAAGDQCFYIAPTVVRPGTGDDLALTVLTSNVTKNYVTAGEFISFKIDSPFGNMDFAVPFIVLQLYAAGAHPGGSFPGMQINFTGPLPPFFMLDGLTALGGFTTLALPPSGITVGGFFPPGLAGFAFTVQGAAVGPAALNTVYATTPAPEFYIY